VKGKNAEQVAHAIEMLNKVIAEVSDDWRVYWFQGKGYLAIGDLSSAYVSFQHAFDLEKQEQAIAREFAGVCLELGKFEQAVELAECAVALQPDCHELIGNLAVSHLLAGHIEAAQKTIYAALKIESNDRINCYLCDVIDDVAAGRRPAPRSMAEVHAKPKPKSKRKPFWQFWKK
jgi:Flp pilus assembly protein TadD